ncbi:hypothetical protein GF377_07045 [candidate division GN15 bacterium]|nr:hypothetical protein [candidate division GN15 bacterium]
MCTMRSAADLTQPQSSRRALIACCTVLVGTIMLLGGMAQPTLAQSGDIEWCGTQTIFEQKYAKHELLQSMAKDPNACPQLGMCDNPATRDSYIPDSTQDIIYIRLYFHLLATTAGDSVVATPAELQAQVDQLNSDYLPHRIQFTYDYRVVNSSQFRYITAQSEFNQMKSQLAVNPANQMNIYVTYVNIGGSVFSFATFPWDSDALSSTGGIVMSDQQFYPSDVHTLTHEIGHCFGLWHTFHGVDEVSQCGPCYESPGDPDNDNRGDLCADTRPTPTTFECDDPNGLDPCSGEPWGVTPIENFMGYSADFCQNEFTTQQAGRMNCWIRDEVITWSEPLFVEATPTFGPAPLTVDFDASSPRDVQGWTWLFGDGELGFVEDPSHEYDTPGVYSVETEISTPQGAFNLDQDSLIYAYADTMWIDSVGGQVGELLVNVNVRNFLPLEEIMIPITWQGDMDLDYLGYVQTGLRSEYMTATQLNYSDFLKRVAVSLNVDNEPLLAPGVGPVLTLRFQVNSGGTGDTNSVAFTTWSSFEAKLNTNETDYIPELANGGIYFPTGCCTGSSVGNVDGSPDQAVTLGDLTTLIDHLFISLGPLACVAEGDLDQSGGSNPQPGDVTLGDLTIMIDHLFISLQPLPPCP